MLKRIFIIISLYLSLVFSVNANVDIKALIALHKSEGRESTLTAVQPPGRYGALQMGENAVSQFREKPDGDNAWINGGFFVLQPSVLDRIPEDRTSFESEVLPELAADGQLSAFRHPGFWQPMDTLRDRNRLEDLWLFLVFRLLFFCLF